MLGRKITNKFIGLRNINVVDADVVYTVDGSPTPELWRRYKKNIVLMNKSFAFSYTYSVDAVPLVTQTAVHSLLYINGRCRCKVVQLHGFEHPSFSNINIWC